MLQYSLSTYRGLTLYSAKTMRTHELKKSRRKCAHELTLWRMTDVGIATTK